MVETDKLMEVLREAEEDNKVYITKLGYSEVTCVGRIFGRIKYFRNSLDDASRISEAKVIFKVNMLPIKSKKSTKNLQIEEFRVYGDEDCKEFLENIRSGMLVAIEAERRAMLYKGVFYNVNILKRIDIIDFQVSKLEATRKELKVYDSLK